MADSPAVERKAVHLMVDALPAFHGVLKEALDDLSQYFSADMDQRKQLVMAALLQARQEVHGG